MMELIDKVIKEYKERYPKKIVDLKNPLIREMIVEATKQLQQENRELLDINVQIRVDKAKERIYEQKYNDLIEYVKLLTDELNEVVPIAHVHGWRSSRVEQGKEMRKKFDELKQSE